MHNRDKAALEAATAKRVEERRLLQDEERKVAEDARIKIEAEREIWAKKLNDERVHIQEQYRIIREKSDKEWKDKQPLRLKGLDIQRQADEENFRKKYEHGIEKLEEAMEKKRQQDAVRRLVEEEGAKNFQDKFDLQRQQEEAELRMLEEAFGQTDMKPQFDRQISTSTISSAKGPVSPKIAKSKLPAKFAK